MNPFIKINTYTLLKRINILRIINNKCQFSMSHMLQTVNIESSQANYEKVSFDQIRVLVNNLDEPERKKLLIDLQHLESDNKKKVAEEKLASWHWRTHFGRPSVRQVSDPSGKFCEIPPDWLQKKINEQAKPKVIESSELRQVALLNALPFIGFGFLDNVIMIVAGDYIDSRIGAYLGISTLAAAALGNTISDLAGIGSAWYVENVAIKIGVRSPNLSPLQLESSPARWSANIGRSIGVVLGCILGMFPLFFLPFHSRKEKLEK